MNSTTVDLDGRVETESPRSGQFCNFPVISMEAAFMRDPDPVVVTFNCDFADDSVNSIRIELPGGKDVIEHPLDRDTCQSHHDDFGNVRARPFEFVVTDSSNRNWNLERWSLRFKRRSDTDAESPFDPESNMFTGSGSCQDIDKRRNCTAYELQPDSPLICTQEGRWRYFLTLDFGERRGRRRRARRGLLIDPEMEVGFEMGPEQ